MDIALNSLASNSVYHLMTQTIVPRPIAWVLSENSDSTHNLAPFSYFNAVCSDPPLLMISMGKKPDGSAKDTGANLALGQHCVVHIAHTQQAELVSATAATLAYGESETTQNDIPLIKQGSWPLKRIENAPIAYLCKVHSRQEMGNTPQLLIFLEALSLYIDDTAVSEEKGRIKVDALAIDPLARLGANQYAKLGNVFSKIRPD